MAEQTQRDSIYLRLARELRAAILRQDFPEGVRLPTEAELADRFGISRQTVRRAFQDLVAEGLVHRVPGRGTFATPRGAVPASVRLGGRPDGSVPRHPHAGRHPLRRRVDVDAAGRLGLHSDRVHKLAFLRLHEDTAFCHTSVFLPPEVGRLLESVAALAEPGTAGATTVIGLLDERLPEPIAEAEQSITVAAADAGIAGHLGCAPGRALLRIDRVYQSAAGRLVELAVSHFLPEHYSYRVRLRRSGR